MTLVGSTVTVYLDGVATGTSSAVNIAPYQMGHALQTWLGRPVYSTNAYYLGRMQDLRVYSRGLSATEIATLAAG